MKYDSIAKFFNRNALNSLDTLRIIPPEEVHVSKDGNNTLRFKVVRLLHPVEPGTQEMFVTSKIKNFRFVIQLNGS